MEKRGVFFSTDALIAMVIIFFVLIVFYPLSEVNQKNSEIHYDVLKMLSSINVGEINDADVRSLALSGNLNNSLLEEIGEIYVTDEDGAKAFASAVLSKLDFGNENFGLWYGNSLIFERGDLPYSDADRIETARMIISGLRGGESVTGFSARALLSSGMRQDYFYFGGYVGEGNLSLRTEYSGTLNSAEMEIAANNDFDVYVNDAYAGHYTKSASEFVPGEYVIPTGNFNSGENIVEIRGEDLYVAGGFVKLTYETDVKYEQPERHYFPGIDGLVNLYDGFYVPGELSSMNIVLHLESESASPFLNIGNVTVYDDSTVGETTISLTNAQLSSLLDYNFLSGKTAPIRLGLANVSYAGQSRAVDVFSVTDLSGSMQCSKSGTLCSLSQWFCQNWCGGVWLGPINSAKSANNLFIEIILNSSDNRVGLVGYESTADPANYHALSNNNASLHSEVNSWAASGSTCICCGINRAVDSLVSDSSLEKFRSIVVMSDGEANVKCAQQGTATAKQDAIKSACDAYEDYGIVVYAVGFGDDADEATLQAIANCGNGSYYYSSVDELEDVYRQIANEIITLYSEQRVSVLGNAYMKLYPDSYIEYIYNKTITPFGLLVSAESRFGDDVSGSFYVPDGSSIVKVDVASYSGARWTDSVKINGNEIYNLGDYGSNYIVLGDPFIVSIPISYVVNGTNYVNLTTGVSPANHSAGSLSNKIIYTLARNASAFSPIKISAEGCNWEIQFEDDSYLNIAIPPAYSGTAVCVYNETSHDNVDPISSNDAYQLAVQELMKKLDLDSDGKVDIVFESQQLELLVDEIQGIPFAWATEVQARVWH